MPDTTIALIQVRPGIWRTEEGDAVIARSRRTGYTNRLSVTVFDRAEWDCKRTRSVKTMKDAVEAIAEIRASIDAQEI